MSGKPSLESYKKCFENTRKLKKGTWVWDSYCDACPFRFECFELTKA